MSPQKETGESPLDPSQTAPEAGERPPAVPVLQLLLEGVGITLPGFKEALQLVRPQHGAALVFDDLDLERHRLFIPQDFDLDLGPLGLGLDKVDEVVHGLDPLAVDAEDDVADLELGLGRGPALGQLGDHHAGPLLDAEALGQLAAEVHAGDADVFPRFPLEGPGHGRARRFAFRGARYRRGGRPGRRHAAKEIGEAQVHLPHGVVLGQLAELGLDVHGFAVALDLERDVLARLHLPDLPGQDIGPGDVPAADLEHDVPRLELGQLGRAVPVDRADDRPALVVLADADAKPAALDPA